VGSHQILVGCKCFKGDSNANYSSPRYFLENHCCCNYSRQLLKAIGRVDGLLLVLRSSRLTSARRDHEEVHKLMLDKGEEWRSKIKMIVAANKEVDSTKKEDKKLGALKLEVLPIYCCYLVY
jgi:hypothetical protein